MKPHVHDVIFQKHHQAYRINDEKQSQYQVKFKGQIILITTWQLYLDKILVS